MEGSALSGAIRQLLKARRSVRTFDPNVLVPEEKLNELKKLCMRAPSSFNAQPFRCVLVRDEQAKKDLSHVMTGLNNSRRVRDAPLTAVFLADTESWKHVMGGANDHTEETETYQQRKRKQADIAFVSGSHGKAFRKLVQSTSTLAPTKLPEDSIVWSVKQTIFFVDHWLLSCAALGLSTAPMEGFDEPRVREIVGAGSSRFYCPVVVPTGFPLEDDLGLAPISPRFETRDVFFDNKIE